MIASKFIAYNKDGKKVVGGVLTQVIGEGSMGQIILDKALNEEGCVIELKQNKKINDVGNFVAAVMNRIDKKSEIEKVKIGRKEFPVIREPARVMREVVMLGGKVIAADTPLVGVDINGNKVEFSPKSLGAEVFNIPGDGRYCRNEMANKLLVELSVDFEVGKAMVKDLVDGIFAAKQSFSRNKDENEYRIRISMMRKLSNPGTYRFVRSATLKGEPGINKEMGEGRYSYIFLIKRSDVMK